MRSLIPLLLLISYNAGAVEVYKWVDAEGTAHFSDTPAAGSVKQEERAAVSVATPRDSTRGVAKLRAAEVDMLNEIDNPQATAAKQRTERELKATRAARERTAQCHKYKKLYAEIGTRAKARRTAARTGETRLRNVFYRRAKRNEYNEKIRERCTRAQ